MAKVARFRMIRYIMIILTYDHSEKLAPLVRETGWSYKKIKVTNLQKNFRGLGI